MNEGYIMTSTGVTIIVYDKMGSWMAVRGILSSGGLRIPSADGIVALFKIKKSKQPILLSGVPIKMVFTDKRSRKITNNYNLAKSVCI